MDIWLDVATTLIRSIDLIKNIKIKHIESFIYPLYVNVTALVSLCELSVVCDSVDLSADMAYYWVNIIDHTCNESLYYNFVLGFFFRVPCSRGVFVHIWEQIDR